MKEVKKDKKEFELDIINSIKSGEKPIDISKRLNISLPNLSYHLSILKKKGIINKIGYGLWEVTTLGRTSNLTHATNLKVDSIRGHAFIWKVRFNNINKIDWKQNLNLKQINYDEVGFQNTPRIIFNNRKIWLGKKHIIIYEPDSFFGDNAIESRKLAVYNLLLILKDLQAIFNLEFKNIEFTPTREHFSMIKNVLAVQCNKNREKINVYNEKGHWLSIDDSFNLGELENLGSIANQPLETNLKVQKWWNENKETNFEVGAKFILESINKITENQNIFDKNIVKHQKVLEEMSETLKAIRDSLTIKR